MLSKMQIEKMITLALEQLSKSYAPYSGFRVGAAPSNEGWQILHRLQYRKCCLYSHELCRENRVFQGGQ